MRHTHPLWGQSWLAGAMFAWVPPFWHIKCDVNFVGESSASGGGVEATTDESPFIEGGTSAEGAAEENEGAAEENEDVNVES